jgi:acetylornithine deacetylase/succinyl-diaminopimelate desuccinylase-like protein
MRDETISIPAKQEEKFVRLNSTAIALLLAATAFPASAQTLRPDQTVFRALYQDLVETNTTLSAGSCTEAAAKMGAHLKAAGYADADLTYFAEPDHPKEGGIVAVMKGSDARVKPLLLLGHIDVVEAKREDWTRDPFKLIEEKGFFYARGTADMKGLAAVWVDTLARFKAQGYKPKRTVKLALTCGEETTYAFNGAQWLTKNRPELIAAEFALNEGGGGVNDAQGNHVALALQVGEKAVQNFRLETTNPGGHSSRPVPENAIYDLAKALTAVQGLEFPVQFTDTTRTFFGNIAKTKGGEIGKAITNLLANPNDAAANSIVSRDPSWHSMLRTTCVATMLDGGHAMNALPQRAGALINCRAFPGETADATRAALTTAINNTKVSITPVPPVRPIAKPPALDPKITGPANELARKYFPGVPILPTMSTGATDGIFLAAIGIPTYGIPGIFAEPDGNGAHGLNERLRVKSLYEGRDYLFDLVKIYASR